MRTTTPERIYLLTCYTIILLLLTQNSYSIECDTCALCNQYAETYDLIELNQSISNLTSTCITIGRDNITIDCKGFNITGDSTLSGINIDNQHSNTIKNCTIKDFSTGIYIYSSTNNTVDNCTLISNYNGIYIYTNSNNNNQTNNTINNNTYGIRIRDSDSNMAKSNHIEKNTYGTHIQSSDNNTIHNNKIKNNTNYEINITGDYNNITRNYFKKTVAPITNYPTGTIFENNIFADWTAGPADEFLADFETLTSAISTATQNGRIHAFKKTYTECLNIAKTLTITGEEKDNTVINCTADTPVNISADNLKFSNFTLTSNTPNHPIINLAGNSTHISNITIENQNIGIQILNTNSHLLEYLKLMDISHALNITSSYNTTIQKSRLTNSSIRALSSTRITIQNNTIKYIENSTILENTNNSLVANNTYEDIWNPIKIISSTNTNITKNTFLTNTYYPIILEHATNSQVSENTMNDTDFSIKAENSDALTISQNTINNTQETAITLKNTNSTHITNNTITTAKKAITIEEGNTNTIYNNTITGITDTSIQFIPMGTQVQYHNNTIEKNTITNTSKAISAQNTHNTKITRNTINTTSLSSASLTLTNATQDNITHNTFTAGTTVATAITLKNANQSQVQGNIFSNYILSSIKFESTSNNENTIKDNIITGGNTPIHIFSNKESKINNNTITGESTLYGIKIEYTNSTNITNNTIEYSNCGVCIISNSQNNRIDNNTIKHNSECGINPQGSQNTEVSNNYIQNASKGIYLQNILNPTVIGNTIVSSDNEAILLFNTYNAEIKNNTITNSGTGLYIENSEYNNITENTFQNNPSNGIELTSDSQYNNLWLNNFSDTSNIFRESLNDYCVMGLDNDYHPSQNDTTPLSCNRTFINSFNDTAIYINDTIEYRANTSWGESSYESLNITINNTNYTTTVTSGDNISGIWTYIFKDTFLPGNYYATQIYYHESDNDEGTYPVYDLNFTVTELDLKTSIYPKTANITDWIGITATVQNNATPIDYVKSEIYWNDTLQDTQIETMFTEINETAREYILLTNKTNRSGTYIVNTTVVAGINKTYTDTFQINYGHTSIKIDETPKLIAYNKTTKQYYNITAMGGDLNNITITYNSTNSSIINITTPPKTVPYLNASETWSSYINITGINEGNATITIILTLSNGTVNYTEEINDDYTPQTCSDLWGFDCGVDCTTPEVDNTHDTCTSCSADWEHVEEVYINGTTFQSGDTVKITCEFDPDGTGTEEYIWVKYPNGTWLKLYDASAPWDFIHNVSVTFSSTEEGEHWARCIVDWDGTGSECEWGGYYDHDDLSFSITGTPEPPNKKEIFVKKINMTADMFPQVANVTQNITITAYIQNNVTEITDVTAKIYWNSTHIASPELEYYATIPAPNPKYIYRTTTFTEHSGNYTASITATATNNATETKYYYINYGTADIIIHTTPHKMNTNTLKEQQISITATDGDLNYTTVTFHSDNESIINITTATQIIPYLNASDTHNISINFTANNTGTAQINVTATPTNGAQDSKTKNITVKELTLDTSLNTTTINITETIQLYANITGNITNIEYATANITWNQTSKQNITLNYYRYYHAEEKHAYTGTITNTERSGDYTALITAKAEIRTNTTETFLVNYGYPQITFNPDPQSMNVTENRTQEITIKPINGDLANITIRLTSDNESTLNLSDTQNPIQTINYILASDATEDSGETVQYNLTGKKLGTTNITANVTSKNNNPTIKKKIIDVTGTPDYTDPNVTAIWTNSSINTYNILDPITIYANISDDSGLETKIAEITKPGGHKENKTMTWSGTGNTYKTQNPFTNTTNTSNYTIKIHAIDYYGNANNTETKNFTLTNIYPSITINTYSLYNRGENATITIHVYDVNNNPVYGFNTTLNITYESNTTTHLENNQTDTYNHYINTSVLGIHNLSTNITKNGNIASNTTTFNTTNILDISYYTTLTTYPPTSYIRELRIYTNYERGDPYLNNLNAYLYCYNDTSNHWGDVALAKSTSNIYSYTSEGDPQCYAPSPSCQQFKITANITDTYNNSGTKLLSLSTSGCTTLQDPPGGGSSSGGGIAGLILNATERVKEYIYGNQTNRTIITDFEFTLNKKETLIKQGEDATIIATLNNIGDIHQKITATIAKQCCNITLKDKTYSIGPKNKEDIPLRIHASLTTDPGEYLTTVTMTTENITKTETFKIKVMVNPLINTMKNIENKIKEHQKEIESYKKIGVDTKNLEKSLNEVKSHIENAKEYIQEDDLKNLETAVKEANSKSYSIELELTKLKTIGWLYENKYLIAITIIAADIIGYLLIYFIIPYYYLQKELKDQKSKELKFKDEERTVQKQYFMRQLDEATFNKLISEKHSALLDTRSQIKQVEEKISLLTRGKLNLKKEEHSKYFILNKITKNKQASTEKKLDIKEKIKSLKEQEYNLIRSTKEAEKNYYSRIITQDELEQITNNNRTKLKTIKTQLHTMKKLQSTPPGKDLKPKESIITKLKQKYSQYRLQKQKARIKNKIHTLQKHEIEIEEKDRELKTKEEQIKKEIENLKKQENQPTDSE